MITRWTIVKNDPTRNTPQLDFFERGTSAADIRDQKRMEVAIFERGHHERWEERYSLHAVAVLNPRH
jgi:hypothetical protein